MSATLAIPVLAAAISMIAWIAWREARKAAAYRHSLLNTALHVLDCPKAEIDACGFPKMDGRYKGHLFRVSLVPDTLTFRRLPQLWLDVTLRRNLPIDGSVAILVRQSGADYFSITDHLHDRLAPPPNFPDVCLVKGEGPGARRILDRIAPYAADLLRDPKFKEIAITPRGIRVMRQISQGKRGDHLILRQIVFENAQLQPDELKNTLEADLAIEAILVNLSLVSAA